VSLWIKICANTSLEDARLAVDAGADAVGFVFAQSPRRMTSAQVAAIAPHLPATVEKIGVFVQADLQEIYATVRACKLTGVQLHSAAGPELTVRLRELLGPELRILRVVHFGPQAAEQAAAIVQDPNVDAVLVDSRTATAVGGTGIAFDWNLARKTLFQDATARKCIAAGGINPANVAEAIATLRPWGVDVASGVEASPGHKDPQKVWEFVARARAAAMGGHLTLIATFPDQDPVVLVSSQLDEEAAHRSEGD
jgi:phosphoribosylanthranilate isomerase